MNNKKTAGITLMELVVVLAIVAIIGAIVVPNFFGMTGIARLRADIQSTMVLDNAFQLYRLQNPTSTHSEIGPVLTELHRQNFLSTQVTEPQEPTSSWEIVGTTIRLRLNEELLAEHAASLTEHEWQMIVNNRPSPPAS